MSAYVDDAPADGRIVELAKQTTSRLEVLWDEVGYTSEEKRRQMQGLIDGFQTLCENKVCEGELPFVTRSMNKVIPDAVRGGCGVICDSTIAVGCPSPLLVHNWLRRLRITGKARRGREKPVHHLYRGCEGQDQDVAEDSRTGACRGMYVV